MVLSSLANVFKGITGRYDLYSTSSTDYNYKTVLWEATKWLSDNYMFPDSYRQYKKDCAVGDYYLDAMTYIKMIKEVTMANADGIIRLERKTLRWIKDNYSDPISDLDQGTPAYYTPFRTGLSPQQVALTSSTYTTQFTYDLLGVRLDDDYDARGVMWMPPTDEIYTVTIEGDFYPLQLSEATDENYWSANHPEILCIACNYILATHQSNIRRMMEIKSIIDDRLFGMEKDVIDEGLPEDPGEFCMRG